MASVLRSAAHQLSRRYDALPAQRNRDAAMEKKMPLAPRSTWWQYGMAWLLVCRRRYPATLRNAGAGTSVVLPACRRWYLTEIRPTGMVFDRAMSSDRASGRQGPTIGPTRQPPNCYSLRDFVLSPSDFKRGAAAPRSLHQFTFHRPCPTAATDPLPRLVDDLLPQGGSP